MKVDWTFLNTFNQVAFKGWSAVWLWIYTGFIWGVGVVVAVATEHALPEGWLLAWLGGLTAYSGVSAYQYKAMRDTDYGALERTNGKAEE